MLRVIQSHKHKVGGGGQIKDHGGVKIFLQAFVRAVGTQAQVARDFALRIMVSVGVVRFLPQE